ncbi:MAG: phospho-N-acetylmuramoyl-pentapeptide-transferase, partial [Verrucomicrobiales bacterium]
MYYLHELHEQFQLFNVFKYITFRAASAAILSFLLCVIFGGRVIRGLTALKLGQPIRTPQEVRELSKLHESKGGTPTMGGVLLLGAVLVSAILFSRPTNPFIQVMVVVLVGLGTLGFVDDYLKVKQKNSKGISARVKLAAQAGIATAVGLFLVLRPETSVYIRELHVPFYKHALIQDMGWFAIPFFVIVIVGCSNAVNLTDGLD